MSVIETRHRAHFNLGVLVLLALGFGCGEAARAFDSETWKAARGDRYSAVRRQMVEDLRANYLHAGLRRDDVLTLLGEPDISDGAQLFYYVAPNGIDPITLIISLDANGTVARSEVVVL